MILILILTEGILVRNINVKLTDDENEELGNLKKKLSKSKREIMRDALMLFIARNRRRKAKRLPKNETHPEN